MVSVADSIREKLMVHFAPERIALNNESGGHNVPPGSESHFNLILVSSRFAGQGRVQRQRKVYSVLSDELNGAVHALTMKVLTPEEWEAAGGDVTNPAPRCRGGDAALVSIR